MFLQPLKYGATFYMRPGQVSGAHQELTYDLPAGKPERFLKQPDPLFF